MYLELLFNLKLYIRTLISVMRTSLNRFKTNDLAMCCLAVRSGKKSPNNQGTGLENRGPLNVLNDTKLVLNELTI
jgi:hypothetical protein